MLHKISTWNIIVQHIRTLCQPWAPPSLYGFDSEIPLRSGFTSFAKPVSVFQMDPADSLKRIWNRFRFRQMDHALRVASIYICIRLIDCFTSLLYKKILKLLCGDLQKNLSHSRVNPQLAMGQLVDSVSEIGADWVIASQDCFGRICNPVTSKYHSLHQPIR